MSSGCKISRAGLAISEKMRAQTAGLNAAQKNVKAGIDINRSDLVKDANSTVTVLPSSRSRPNSSQAAPGLRFGESPWYSFLPRKRVLRMR